MTETNHLPKILCVDDEASILSSLERLLKSRFRVLTATSPGATWLFGPPEMTSVRAVIDGSASQYAGSGERSWRMTSRIAKA